MSLIYNLGTEVRGDRLAEVVEASMREIDRWRFEIKEDVRIEESGMRAISHRKVESYPYDSKEKVSFVLYSVYSPQEGKVRVAYSLRKKEGERIFPPGDWLGVGFLSLFGTVISFGLGGFDFVKDLYTELIQDPEFALNDSIFTLIDPKKEYSQLEFYANAAFNFGVPPDGGMVRQENSPQFNKIQPTYDLLLQGIRKKLPPQSPYRTLPNLL